MIYLQRVISNPVVLTLDEKKTLPEAAYLFRFTNDTSGQSVVFTCPDLSNQPQRYNRFFIEALQAGDPNEDLYDGKPILNLTGYWTYQIGEIVPSSPQDLDWSNITSIVETGKVFVQNPDEDVPAEFTQNDATDNTVYFDEP